MNHLTDEQLNEYLDNVLEPAARTDAHRHIESCPGCQARLDEIQAVTAMLAGLPEIPLTHDLSKNVLLRLPQKSGRIWTRALAAELGGALGMLLWLSAEMSKPVAALLLTLALPKISLPAIHFPEYALKLPSFNVPTAIPRLQVTLPPLPLPVLNLPAFDPRLVVPVAILVFLLWIVGNNMLLRAPTGARR